MQGAQYQMYWAARAEISSSYPIAAKICLMNTTGISVTSHTQVFNRNYRCRYILANSVSPLPCAGETKEPMTNEKLVLIEIRRIPVVREPSPNAAKYFDSIRPTTAALITEYIGWKDRPRMGQRANLEISLTAVQKLRSYSSSSTLILVSFYFVKSSSFVVMEQIWF